MEKFCLKWNDFQVNVTKSFRFLREEKDFFDVTLISDDEQHISAHKVVLSASSVFFKSILKAAQHQSPMIYLTGINSKDLQGIMDYIYQGEVQLYQDDLDSFLNTAQRLKIDGLIGGNEKKEVKEEEVLESSQESYQEDKPSLSKAKPSRNMEIAVNASNVDAKAAVDELVERIPDGWQCKSCGKTTKKVSDVRRHAELHIEGLSFECPLCKKSFRCRMSLKHHKSKCPVSFMFQK